MTETEVVRFQNQLLQEYREAYDLQKRYITALQEEIADLTAQIEQLTLQLDHANEVLSW